MAQDNPFAKYAPSTGPLPSPQKKPAPMSQGEAARLDIDREQLRIAQAKEARELAEGREKLGKYANSKTTALDTMGRVFRQLTDVAKAARDGWATTGKFGAFVRNDLPKSLSAGSDAYDLQRSIDMIDANNAFAALQEMRNNSPTGGALGAITEKELDLLKSTIASLDPNQSKDQLMRNIVKAKQAYVGMMRRIDPKAAAKYIRQSGKAPSSQKVLTYNPDTGELE